MVDWARLHPYFKPTDSWGNSSLIKPDLLYELVEFRKFISNPIIVTSGTNGRHAEGSSHYTGEAIDFVVPDCQVSSLLDLFIAASRFHFTEIGLYTGWSCNGTSCAGMHLGWRLHLRREFWLTNIRNGAVSENELNSDNLRALGCIVDCTA